MNENFQSLAPEPQPAPNQPPQNQTPLPPPPAESQVGIRTMSTDMSSLKSSGGMEPQQQTFNPRDLGSADPAFQPQPAAGSETVVVAGAVHDEAYRQHHTRSLIISIASAAIIGIIAVASYFIFFRGPSVPPPPPVVIVAPSIIFSATPSTVVAGEPVNLVWETTDATEVTIEGIGPVELRGSRTVTPTESIDYHLVATGAGGTKDATVQVFVTPPVVVAPPFEHKSMFLASANISSTNLSLASLTVAEFKAALGAAAAAEAKIPVLKEFVTVLPDGPVDAWRLFPLFLPSLSAPGFVMPIERDFTGFFYKDGNGSWPGYVVQVSAGADAAAFIAEIEKSPAVFYIDDPGAPKGTFKDGAKFSANVQSVRYLGYTKTGASFNIATVKIADKTYVLISTSFIGMKAAAKALGF